MRVYLALAATCTIPAIAALVTGFWQLSVTIALALLVLLPLGIELQRRRP